MGIRSLIWVCTLLTLVLILILFVKVMINNYLSSFSSKTLNGTERIVIERITPCEPNPCGSNAECREQNGIGSCQCLPEHYGDPYQSCRPECLHNSDCPRTKACIQNKCADPCPGTCGTHADCLVTNHLPTCTCHAGFIGDPYRYCHLEQKQRKKKPSYHSTNSCNYPFTTLANGRPEFINLCSPSPCGPNSQCKIFEGQAICSCLENYLGLPPNCRPECILSTECPTDKACIKQRCQDPCLAICGTNAECHVRNHSPICKCRPGFTGDAFTRCFNIPRNFSLISTVRKKTLIVCICHSCPPNSENNRQ